MELWVRSQDRKCLIKTDMLEYELDANNKVIIKGSADMDSWYHTLGKYKTKERALKVLDEIQRHLVVINDDNTFYVYEMPEE